MSTLPSVSHATGWRAGFRLDVSTWADPAAPSGGPCLVTGRSAGELAVKTGPGAHPCSVRVALPTAGITLLWHDGFACGPAGREPTLLAAMPAPGVLVLRGLTEVPVLFSPEGGVENLPEGQVLDTGPLRVGVSVDPAHPDSAVLILGAGDARQCVEEARAWFAYPLEDWFSAGRERRAFLEHLPSGDETAPALSAFEVLAGALRPAAGPLRQRWSDRGDGGFSPDEVPLLVATWMAWDPAVARELVLSALQGVTGEGFPTSRLFPATGEVSAVPARPGLARAAADFLREHPASDLSSTLPELRQRVSWWLSRSDPHRRGVPVWPEAESSPTPALWDADLGSVGLTALLVQDLSGIAEMSALVPDPGRDDRWIQLERERLPDLLEHHFFNTQSGRFSDRYVGGDPVRRMGLGGLLAVGVRELAAEPRRRHQKDWEGATSLLGREGIRSWEPWPGDEAPPPVPVATQFMAPSALAADEDATRRPRALRVVRNRLLSLLREGGGLGDGLLEAPSDPGWNVSAAALLLYTVQECAGTAEVRPLSPWMRWAEKNRRRVGLVVVGTASLALFLMIAVASLSKDVSHAPQSTLAGLAKNKYALGHHQEAIALYEDLLHQFPESDLVGDYRQMLGNCHFHLGEWAKAESYYRQAARDRPDFAQPLWNLAQALHRQGRVREALEILDQVEKTFSGKLPVLLRKVHDARTVILQQEQAGKSTTRPAPAALEIQPPRT